MVSSSRRTRARKQQDTPRGHPEPDSPWVEFFTSLLQGKNFPSSFASLSGRPLFKLQPWHLIHHAWDESLAGLSRWLNRAASPPGLSSQCQLQAAGS